MKVSIYLYPRKTASLDDQRQKLTAFGPWDVEWVDNLTPKTIKAGTQREQLGEMLKFVQTGDVVKCVSAGILAKSEKDFVTTFDWLRLRGVRLICLDDNLDTDATGLEIASRVLSAIKRAKPMWRERDTETIKTKRKSLGGRPRVKVDREAALADWNNWMELTADDVAKKHGVSKTTLRNMFGNRGEQTPLGKIA